MSELHCSLEGALAHLERAAAALGEGADLGLYEDYLAQNELARAAGALRDAAGDAPPAFWEALGEACASLGLPRPARSTA